MASPWEQEFKDFKPNPHLGFQPEEKLHLELIIMTLESLISIGLKKI